MLNDFLVNIIFYIVLELLGKTCFKKTKQKKTLYFKAPATALLFAIYLQVEYISRCSKENDTYYTHLQGEKMLVCNNPKNK